MNLIEPKLSVSLPLHDIPEREFYCYRCEGKMDLCTASIVYKYKGQKVRVSNIRMYRCRECRENVYSSDEAKMIEDAIKSVVED